MPYFVERDASGAIVVAHASVQHGRAEEELQDSDPEILKFFEKFPPGFLTPPSPEEVKAAQIRQIVLDQELHAIQESVTLFTRSFSALELSLSDLLARILNLSNGRFAFAIYFSAPGFGARVELVGNVMAEFAQNDKAFGVVAEIWQRIEKKLHRIRKFRNAIAHGSGEMIIFQGRHFARLIPPSFDVVRLKTNDPAQRAPGLSAEDIGSAASRSSLAATLVRDVGIAVSELYINKAGGLEMLAKLQQNMDQNVTPPKLVSTVSISVI